MPKRGGRKYNRRLICTADFWFSTIRRWRNPYSKYNALVYRHWSGKQKEVVSGIHLITLLWTDGVRCVPADYRIFNKDRDRKTKNDHFAEMPIEAFERGFTPQLVCFDSWYSSIENLKLCRSLGWHFLTRLKANRRIRIGDGKLQAVSEAGLTGGDGTVAWLKGFGQIKVFRIFATDGTSEYWATSLDEMSEPERKDFAGAAWRIEMYHRSLKQQCRSNAHNAEISSGVESYRTVYQSVCAN